jgi:hypothetical protein
MRFVLASLALVLLPAASVGPAAALPGAVPQVSVPQVLVTTPAADHVVLAAHRNNHIRFFNRTPASPYQSYGHPRLYYYPWGLRPDKRRWFHR